MDPFAENSVVKSHRTLSDNTRLTEFVVDETDTFILLEVGGEDNWSSVLAYEICGDDTVKRHEFTNTKEQKTRELKISPEVVSSFKEVVISLLLNDLLNRWEKYCKNFIGGEEQIVFEPTMIIETAISESPKVELPQELKKSQTSLDRFLMKYNLGKVLDRNEYFVFREAVRKRKEKPVVIKTVKIDLPDRQATLARHILEREAGLLVKLKNPGIIALEDSHFDSYNACLVIEPYGETLEERINQKEIDQSELVWIGQQICILLKYLHQRKKTVLYLNLSPKSISFKDDILMLHDFSKASYLVPIRKKSSEGYSPPEHFLTELEQRSDLFSLGRVLIRLAAARKESLEKSSQEPATFAKSVHKQIVAQKESLAGSYIDPKKIDSGIPDLDKLIIRLIDPIPNFRPDNVDEVLNDLNQIAKNLDQSLDFTP